MSDLEAFREEAQQWLRANAPATMFAPVKGVDDLCFGGGKVPYPRDVRRWLEIMAARGWTAPTWPRELGGGGLSRAEAKALAEEMAKLRLRPPLVGFGLTMIGPLLLQEGTAEQKREHIPRIVRGEIRWCQGYSEPGAGSDLASLQTKAVRDGDDYIVNGQKIWTSDADKADWMFLLVRTDPTGPKHDGITFLLMDMSSSGVSARPITLISGASPFCETFMNEVRVPARNVVGRVDGGWQVAKALLGYERDMIADAFKQRDERARLLDIARRYLPAVDGRIGDAVLRDRITQVEMDQECLDLTLARSRARMRAGHAPGPETSIFKYYGTELNKRRRELMVSVIGPQALGWEGSGFAEDELRLTRDWLRSRGNSIEGGTSEIQLNIIAKRVLGLPD